MSQQHLVLTKIDWSKSWDAVLASLCYALTEVNNWTIRHPYVVVGALICTLVNPYILVTPLRFMGRTAGHIFEFIGWSFKVLGRFILYIFGFRREGVAEDSLASQYQSYHYGGHVPQDSLSAGFQSYGAAGDYLHRLEAASAAAADDHEDTEISTFAGSVRWLSGLGINLILSRAWGWWHLMGVYVVVYLCIGLIAFWLLRRREAQAHTLPSTST
ncbi:uncharacterized protein EDB91DRAFT_681666 [Suillus paluster]|uniref:uncharacterized protein n=1 Tax=Suillus paluster TaxID=48578 RepID=UPI001B87AC3C|nr:uncharacterized protein EDB91DRAFT_681666 [Suillus paluster]KAG1718009.1 hypothetical protein EDB91DRAFT_681666 [Suillus paluster]